MPNLILSDKPEEIFDPIIFTIGGKVYGLKDNLITQKRFLQILEYYERAIGGDEDALVKQFCDLTGANLKYVKENIDIRIIGKCIKFFLESIQNPMEKTSAKKKTVSIT